ncbi:MAG TPA: hypothetical protein VJ204_07130 [Solirubrobacterales bacterium]|nr:hypothetical protein [Solirubrobacterales bacterium]
MSTRELKRLLAGADPVDRARLGRLDLAAMEGELTADLEGSWPVADPGRATEIRAADAGLLPRPYRRRPGNLVLAGGAGALAVIVVALVLVLAGGGGGSSSRAYGAELIRFAESTPLLLLEEPGWRVQDVIEQPAREGSVGFMEFVTGKDVPEPNIRPVRPARTTKSGQVVVTGVQPASVRQRLVQLRWRPVSEGSIEAGAGGKHRVELPVLDTTATVNTHAEMFPGHVGPPDREMLATWTEGGVVIELQAAVPDLAGMEERLGWVTKVDSQTWLEAMPAKVVKAADFEGSVKEILKGIPLPKTFAISRVPNPGLTTSRDDVAGEVTGTVACLWLRQWGEARRDGDGAAEVEAEKAMASSHNWPVFRDAKGGAPYPAREIEEVAAAMPSGYWPFHGHHRDLLAHAESIGCARAGIPLLPEKMKRQREDGVPPPPD